MVATALVSMRLRASGGILMVSRLLTRRYMMDFERSCGTTTFAPEMPRVLPTVPLMMFWLANGVSYRASQRAGAPPGRWHCEQFESRYDRTPQVRAAVVLVRLTSLS